MLIHSLATLCVKASSGDVSVQTAPWKYEKRPVAGNSGESAQRLKESRSTTQDGIAALSDWAWIDDIRRSSEFATGFIAIPIPVPIPKGPSPHRERAALPLPPPGGR